MPESHGAWVCLSQPKNVILVCVFLLTFFSLVPIAAQVFCIKMLLQFKIPSLLCLFVGLQNLSKNCGINQYGYKLIIIIIVCYIIIKITILILMAGLN